MRFYDFILPLLRLHRPVTLFSLHPSSPKIFTMFLFALLLGLLQILLPMPLKRHIQTLNDLGRNHKKQKFVSDGASWASLPKEIQIMILESVAQCRRPTAGHTPGRIATYATVSLEWQGFFERITFRRLTLDFPALEFFAGAVSGEKHIHRLNYIRHIWLRIKLLDYTCLTCSEAENGYTIYRYVFPNPLSVRI